MPNVIRRNVLFASCQLPLSSSSEKLQHSFCTTENNDVENIDDEQAPSRKPRFKFEPAAETGQLTFTIPGLSPREETFVKQQVRIILKPDCMTEKTIERKYDCSIGQLFFFH